MVILQHLERGPGDLKVGGSTRLNCGISHLQKSTRDVGSTDDIYKRHEPSFIYT